MLKISSSISWFDSERAVQFRCVRIEVITADCLSAYGSSILPRIAKNSAGNRIVILTDVNYVREVFKFDNETWGFRSILSGILCSYHHIITALLMMRFSIT